MPPFSAALTQQKPKRGYCVRGVVGLAPCKCFSFSVLIRMLSADHCLSIGSGSEN